MGNTINEIPNGYVLPPGSMRLHRVTQMGLEPDLRPGDFVLLRTIDRIVWDGIYLFESPFHPQLYVVQNSGDNVLLTSPGFRTSDKLRRRDADATVLGIVAAQVKITDPSLLA